MHVDKNDTLHALSVVLRLCIGFVFSTRSERTMATVAVGRPHAIGERDTSSAGAAVESRRALAHRRAHAPALAARACACAAPAATVCAAGTAALAL